jgi:hypothetical protein
MLRCFRSLRGFALPHLSTVVLVLCAVHFSAAGALATTTKQDALRLLGAAVAADELTRATIARQIGDDTLLTALHQVEDVVLRLAAVRCSPYLSDPDRALRDLTLLARGRDPELAPAAALRLLQISQALVQRAASCELPRDSVRDARSELLALADDRTALAQIRVYAGQAGYLLGEVLAVEGAR